MAQRRKRGLPQGEFEADIQGLSHDGKGVARLDGKVHFIFGALPGERVRFRYVKNRSKFAEGVVTDVLVPSKERVEPPCPYFGSCGGCSLQHLAPHSQVRVKESTLMEQLESFGASRPRELLPAITGPTTCYRRSARLGARFVPQKGGLLIGFRERYSHYIQDMTSCVILEEAISSEIPLLKEVLGSASIRDRLPQVETYLAENGLFIVIRHLTPFLESDLMLLKEYAQREGIFLFLQPGGPETIHPLFPSSTPTPFYTLKGPDMEMMLEFSPGDFIQVNRVVNQRLVEAAMEFLEPRAGDVVWDFFCGIGNFTLPTALHVKQVVGFEVVERMVEQARTNARKNAISNVSFRALDLMEDVSKLLSEARVPGKVILDPPRSGAKELSRLLAKGPKPERIVYVSCNPSTFSRDAGLLRAGGYHLEKVRIVDMFPHTGHAETIGVFSR